MARRSNAASTRSTPVGLLGDWGVDEEKVAAPLGERRHAFATSQTRYVITAATMDAAASSAAESTAPIGSPRAELGSHCTSSGGSVPSGLLMSTTRGLLITRWGW